MVLVPTPIRLDARRAFRSWSMRTRCGLLEVNCPAEARLSGARGPDARVHFEYHARHRSPAFVGEELVVRAGYRALHQA